MIFDGWCAARGIEPLELRPDRFLNLIYYWLVGEGDEEHRAKIDALLDEPVPGQTVEQVTEDDPAWSAEAEMEAFMAAKSAGA